MKRSVCFNRSVSLHRFRVAFLLALCLGGNFALGQTPNPPVPPPPVSGSSNQSPQQKEESKPGTNAEEQPAPEKKISPQEAEELFRSADDILRFASKQTGLPMKHEVKHKLTSRDEVQKFIEKRMKDDPDAKRFEDSEFVMKKFGLLPGDFNLRKFMVSMLREQVAGYYDTKTKTMNLLDWLPLDAQKPVMAHELTHALQDQSINLEKWEAGGKPEGKKLSLPEQLALDEVRVARQSVTEGQAMLVLIDYSLVPLGRSVVDAPDVVKLMEDQMMDGAGSPVFASAPLYVKRAMMFAYREGTEFERQVLVQSGKENAFQGTLEHPPQDTREVMEPDNYLAGKHIPLLKVPDYDKILGHNWEQMDFGALGEFDVSVLMEIYSDADTANDLAKGWRGGYYYAARKKGSPPESVAFIYVSKWRDEDDAAEFAKILASSWKQRYKNLRTDSAQEQDSLPTIRRQTEAGPVSVQRNGNLVIAIESFPEADATKLRSAALEFNASGSQNAKVIPLRAMPLFDPRNYVPCPMFLLGHSALVKP